MYTLILIKINILLVINMLEIVKVRLSEYKKPQHLLLAFKKWETNYSVPFDILKLNQNEQLLYLGYILKENQLKSQELTQALKKIT